MVRCRRSGCEARCRCGASCRLGPLPIAPSRGRARARCWRGAEPLNGTPTAARTARLGHHQRPRPPVIPAMLRMSITKSAAAARKHSFGRSLQRRLNFTADPSRSSSKGRMRGVAVAAAKSTDRRVALKRQARQGVAHEGNNGLRSFCLSIMPVWSSHAIAGARLQGLGSTRTAGEVVATSKSRSN